MEAATGSGAAPPPSGEVAVIQEVSDPLYAGRNWIKLMAILMIVSGVLGAIGLVPLLYIWVGVLMWQAAAGAEAARMTGNKLQLIAALDKLKTCFTIAGVVTLVSIVLSVLMSAIFGGLIMARIAEEGGLENF